MKLNVWINAKTGVNARFSWVDPAVQIVLCSYVLLILFAAVSIMNHHVSRKYLHLSRRIKKTSKQTIRGLEEIRFHQRLLV